MRILVIGGTKFVGPPLVQQLVNNGHDVTLFHRGKTFDDRTNGANTIVGDRDQLSDYVEDFRKLLPDVVLDMIPYTLVEAQELMEAMKGVTSRVIALSSADVYLAYGRLHRTEPGPAVRVPLREDSPLRRELGPEGESYDKISVEDIVMGSNDIAGTMLRLPAIYGPKDELYRFRRFIKPMVDGRPALIMPEDWSQWRFSHEYVDNVAHAVVLAIENERSIGQIYNVAEVETPTQMERALKIGELLGWKGRMISLTNDRCPEHLRVNVDLSQHWVVDSTKIRSDLGYGEIVPEHEALERTVEWQLANPPEVDPIKFDYDAEDAILDAL